ncbi:MAG: enoyl-CoA hydratase/isomerase family protein [Halobacteriales archaeon]
MPQYDTIAVDIDDGAAVITLDRPETRNALSMALIEELVAELDRLERQRDIRGVILTGAGSAFSSGYDLTEPIGDSEGPPSAEEWMVRLADQPEHIYTIYELDLPVIAAVNGPAIAGGSDLAFICDLTFASEAAEFGYPALRMGGLTATLTYPFVANSIKHARELLYSGKVIDAETAERFEMVNRTVPEDRLMATVFEELEEIKKAPRPVVTLSKHMLNGVVEQQGFRPSVKNSEFIAALAHLSEAGKRFDRLVDQDGLNAAFEWMYNAEKS